MISKELKIEEENRKFWRNMKELDEMSCKTKRINGFPCSKEICDRYNTDRCLHPEKADFPAKRQ